MTRVSIFVLTISFIITGCGKTNEQKAMEKQLSAGVMEIHHRQMQEMSEILDFMDGIDIELVNHDRLAAVHPREFTGRTADDLVGAKKMLLAAKSSMENWMSGFVAYDPSMTHEEAMAKLNKDREDLQGIQKSLDSARKAAEDALDAHRRFAKRFSAPQKKEPTKR